MVTLALSADVLKLEEAGLIEPGWEKELPNSSIITNSAVAFLTRPGNPKRIRHLERPQQARCHGCHRQPQDLRGGPLELPGSVGIRHPERWHAQQAEAFVTGVYKNVENLPKDAREASDVFLKRDQGDVLLNYENEAILATKTGDLKDPFVVPEQNIRIEGPVAVVDSNVDRKGTREAAEALASYLFSDEAQAIFAEEGFPSHQPHGLGTGEGPLCTREAVLLRAGFRRLEAGEQGILRRWRHLGSPVRQNPLNTPCVNSSPSTPTPPPTWASPSGPQPPRRCLPASMPTAGGWRVSLPMARPSPCCGRRASGFLRLADQLAERSPKAHVSIAHIRKATQGRVALENCHPFSRRWRGQTWVFAHNGHLRGDIPGGDRYRPLGCTDSEAAFCWILEQLDQAGVDPHDPAALFVQLHRCAAALAERGTFNALISNGQWLFATATSRLHWLTRRAPFQRATLADPPLQVDFSTLTTAKDVVTILSTEPLTTDEHWQPFRAGESLLFCSGEVIHRHESGWTPDAATA